MPTRKRVTSSRHFGEIMRSPINAGGGATRATATKLPRTQKSYPPRKHSKPHKSTQTMAFHLQASSSHAVTGIPAEISVSRRLRPPIALAPPMWSLQRPSLSTQQQQQQQKAVTIHINNNAVFHQPLVYASHDTWDRALADKGIAVIEADDDCMTSHSTEGESC